MTTLAEPDVRNIEAFEYSPECGTDNHHNGSRPPATHICDQHGCEGGYICPECITDGRRRFYEVLRVHGSVTCNVCDAEYTVFENCVKLAPL